MGMSKINNNYEQLFSWSKVLRKESQKMDFIFLLTVSNEELMSIRGREYHRNGSVLK